jgi:hypothetical protein
MADEHSPNPYEAPQSELHQSPVPAQLVRVNPIYFEGNLEELGKWLLDLYAVRVNGLGKLLLQPGISYAIVLIMMLMTIIFIKLSYGNKAQEIISISFAVSIPSIFICYFYQRKWLPVWNRANVPNWFPKWLWWVLKQFNLVGYQYAYIYCYFVVFIDIIRLDFESIKLLYICLSSLLLLTILLFNVTVLIIAQRTGHLNKVVVLWLTVLLYCLLPVLKSWLLYKELYKDVWARAFAIDFLFLTFATFAVNNRLALLGRMYVLESRFTAIEVLDLGQEKDSS